MSSGQLTFDPGAVVANWRALDAKSAGETAAVVKANGYGLGVKPVATALAAAGVRKFFVAIAAEGAELRRALGPEPMIGVFAGHMEGDTRLIREFDLTPMVNSVDQLLRHVEALPGHAFGVQLDSGMNRLGMEPAEWQAVRDVALRIKPVLIMSHLACADEPDHPMNAAQLKTFREMTDGTGVDRSLAATGGILLGPDYHFELTRPGIGLYGGAPFTEARPVIRLDLPVITIRDVEEGEPVGYGATWIAPRPVRIATVAAGYADGLIRAMGNEGALYHGDIRCPIRGRVSMDLITAELDGTDDDPDFLTILGPRQGIDAVADAAGTIGYEILTSLGRRYRRSIAE